MTTVLPATSAVRMAAEQTTVRTPSVPEPRATSTSVRYVFPLLSLHDTVPACGSRVAVTISVCPAGMPPVGTVTAMVVPVAPLLAEPTFRTNAIAAAASDGESATTRPSSAAAGTSRRVRASVDVDPKRMGVPPEVERCRAVPNGLQAMWSRKGDAFPDMLRTPRARHVPQRAAKLQRKLGTASCCDPHGRKRVRSDATNAHPLCDAPRRRSSLAMQLERSGAVVDGWDGATGPAWEAAAAVDRPRAARQDARP